MNDRSTGERTRGERTSFLKASLLTSLKWGVVPSDLYVLAGEPKDENLEKFMSLPSRVGDLYDGFDNLLQADFREVVADVIKDWSMDRDGLDCLSDLTFIVSDTDAVEAISHLAAKVDKVLIGRGGEEAGNAIAKVVGVIGGFVGRVYGGDIAAVPILKRWFEDPRFEKYVGQMMIALSTDEPDNYPLFLERFTEVNALHPDYFDTKLVLIFLKYKIGVGQINDHLAGLSDAARCLLETSGVLADD